MTELERALLKNEILEQIAIDSRLIEDLTPVENPADNDKIELDGARYVSIGRLRKLFGMNESFLSLYLREHGYATETWVQTKGYLTGHQSLSGYVKIGTDGVAEMGRYIDFHSADYGTDITEDYTVRLDAGGNSVSRIFNFPTSGGTLATQSWVENKGYALSSALGDYVLKTSYTASDVLSKLLAVDGSGSLLDADLLDGWHRDNIRKGVLAFTCFHGTNVSGGYDLNTLAPDGGIISNYGDIGYWGNAPIGATYGFALHLKTDYNLGGMLFADSNHNSTTDVTRSLWWRSSASVNSVKTWGEWHKIAFTDSNVASATKLATTRYLWGQPFNGTADVTGLIKADSGVQIGGTDDIGWYLRDSRITAGSVHARGVNIGSLLVSNAWADSNKVPANGAYVKGTLRIGDCEISWDSESEMLKFSKGIYSLGAISARGVNSNGGSGGGLIQNVYGSGSLGGAFSDSTLTDTFNAYTINDINSRLVSHLLGTGLHITSAERVLWNQTATNLTTILGSNADNVINKWDEIVSFLATYTEADTLANLLSNKVDKVTGYGLSKNDFTDALLTKLNGIEDGANRYVHPTNGANTTITAANGKVISAITVNSLGHVTSVSSKTLAASDIPTLAISKISGLQAALDSKLNASIFNDFKTLFETYFTLENINGEKRIKANFGLYSESFISARGVNANGSAGGSAFNLMRTWDNSQNGNNNTTYALGANLGWELKQAIADTNTRIDNLPSTSVNPYALTIQKNGTTLGIYDGSVAKTINISDVASASVLSTHTSNSTIHITANERTLWNQTATNLSSILGSNADNIINKWDEIVAFLDTYTEADTLANLLGNKADKTITISAGTGLTGGGTLVANRTLSLATSGITAGTYTKLTVDAYGRATAGSTLVAADIPTLVISKINGLQAALDAKVAKAGDTMTGNLAFATIATWPTSSTETYPIESKGITWSGSSDSANIFYRVSASNRGNLVMNMGDDTDPSILFEWSKATSYTFNKTTLLASGVAATFQSLKIGDCEISWDATAGGLKFSKGLYSTGFISARGSNSSGGSSGGSNFNLMRTWPTSAPSSTTIDALAANLGWELYQNKLNKYSSSGVLEVARYIDFHTINNGVIGTEDYTVRLDAGTASTGRVFTFPTTGGVVATEAFVTGKGYLTGITKAQVEGVLTGDIATHTHSQYLTSHQSLANYYTKSEADGRFLKLSGGTMANDNIVTNLNADKLDGYHYNRFVPKSIYNPKNGVLVTTSVAQTVSKMMIFRIVGNIYNTGNTPIDTIIQIYSYQGNTFTNGPGMLNNGYKLPYVKVFYADNVVKMWIPYVGNFWSYDVYCYDSMGGSGTNLVTAIADSADVSDSGTAALQINPKNSALTTDNVASASKLATARSLTVGNTAKNFDGSANVAWSLAEIGAVSKAGDTMTGGLTVPKLTINSTSQTEHLAFSRGSYNYITAPANGSLAFVADGKATSGATTDFLISNGEITSGQQNNAVTLGASSYRWKNVYSVLGNFSGLITASAGIKIGEVTITYDSAKNGLKISGGGLYSESYISARGANSAGGSGGVSYNRLDNWVDYTTAKASYVLSAKLGYDLYQNKLSAITKAMVENVLTGNITSHEHQYIRGLNTSDIASSVSGSYGLGYYRGQSTTEGIFPTNSNANGWITLHTHSGNFYHQLGFSSNGNLYHRNFTNTPINTTTPWNVILTSANIGSYAITEHQSLANYVTTNTQQSISALKTFIGGLNLRFSYDTSNAIGIGWKATDGTTTKQSIIAHNTANRIYLNPNGSENVWVDEVGKYSLRIGENSLTYNTYPILRSDNYASYLDTHYLPLSGGTMANTNVVTNLNADLVDGKHAGNASGNIPVSNGTVSTNLYAQYTSNLVARVMSATDDFNTLANFNTAKSSGFVACNLGSLNTLEGIGLYSTLVNFGYNLRTFQIQSNAYSDVNNRLKWRTVVNNGANAPVQYTFGNWYSIAFTDSNVASATKLNTGSNTYSAWGQTFWQNGVPNSISGNMTNVGNISPSGNGANNLGTLNSRWNVIFAQAVCVLSSGLYPMTEDGNYSDSTLIRNGSIELSYSTPYIDFHFNNSASDYTSRIIEELSGQLKIDSIIHNTNGIYSDSYISARGCNTSSDERKKNIVGPFHISLDRIASAPAVIFRWKSDDKMDVGSIAQYWHGVNPLLAPEDPDGYLSLQYGKTALLGLITVADEIKALKAEVKRLQDKILTLQTFK